MQVVEKKSFLAQLESLDMGKPIAEAEWDMVRRVAAVYTTASASSPLAAMQCTLVSRAQLIPPAGRRSRLL